VQVANPTPCLVSRRTPGRYGGQELRDSTPVGHSLTRGYAWQWGGETLSAHLGPASSTNESGRRQPTRTVNPAPSPLVTLSRNGHPPHRQGGCGRPPTTSRNRNRPSAQGPPSCVQVGPGRLGGPVRLLPRGVAPRSRLPGTRLGHVAEEPPSGPTRRHDLYVYISYRRRRCKRFDGSFLSDWRTLGCTGKTDGYRPASVEPAARQIGQRRTEQE